MIPAVSLAVGKLDNGINWATGLREPIHNHEDIVLPSEDGRLMTKSKEMWDLGQRGTG